MGLWGWELCRDEEEDWGGRCPGFTCRLRMVLTGLGGGISATAFCRAGLHSRRSSWPCAEERGAGMGMSPSAALGAQKNGGRMGERLG